MLVVDASPILELLLQTPRGARIEERLFDASEVLAAPHLLDLEVAQVLRRCVRTAELSVGRAAEALADLADMPIERYPHTVLLPRVWELRDNLTAYDAVYLALAEALRATLVTCDRRVARAAGRKATVEVF